MRRMVVAMAAVLALSGCIRTYTTDLSVPPPGVRVPVAGAQAVSVKVSAVDARVDQTRIGTLTSGVMKDEKHIMASDTPVADSVQKAVEAELAARGIGLGNGPAFLLVDIELLEGEGRWGYLLTWARGATGLKAQVLDSDGRVYFTRRYKHEGLGTYESNMSPTRGARMALDSLLSELIREMLEDDELVAALLVAGRRKGPVA